MNGKSTKRVRSLGELEKKTQRNGGAEMKRKIRKMSVKKWLFDINKLLYKIDELWKKIKIEDEKDREAKEWNELREAFKQVEKMAENPELLQEERGNLFGSIRHIQILICDLRTN